MALTSRPSPDVIRLSQMAPMYRTALRKHTVTRVVKGGVPGHAMCTTWYVGSGTTLVVIFLRHPRFPCFPGEVGRAQDGTRVESHFLTLDGFENAVRPRMVRRDSWGHVQMLFRL